MSGGFYSNSNGYNSHNTYTHQQSFSEQPDYTNGQPSGWGTAPNHFQPASNTYPPVTEHHSYMGGSSYSNYMDQSMPASPPPPSGAYSGFIPQPQYASPPTEYAPTQQSWYSTPSAFNQPQQQSLMPINTNVNTFGGAIHSPTPSSAGAMQLFSPQQGGQSLSENHLFQDALMRVFDRDPNINEPETLEAVTRVNILIPGMQYFNTFLSRNHLRWDEGQKFKFAIHAIMYKPHFVCENSKATAETIMKNPCANMLPDTLHGWPIKTPNDEAMQQIAFLGTAYGIFNKEGACFNTVAPGVTDTIVNPVMSIIPERLSKSDKPKGTGLTAGVEQAGAHHYGPYRLSGDFFQRPVRLYVFTDGVSRSSRDDFSNGIELFLSQNEANRVTVCPNQDDSNFLIGKFSSSGGSQINFLNALTKQFPGKLDSCEDFKAENAKNPQHMKDPSDYFYRLAMGVHDPAVMRNANLLGDTSYNTKTKAMLKLGRDALPIIAKIGIKVALTV